MKRIIPIIFISLILLFLANISTAQDFGFSLTLEEYEQIHIDFVFGIENKIDWTKSQMNNINYGSGLQYLNGFTAQQIFLGAFLNLFPGMGLGNFYLGNKTWGIIQVGLQLTGLVIYGVAFNIQDIDIHHSLTNTGHYVFFGASLIGIISAIVYGVSHSGY
jgi:hypothetical protein